MGRRQKALPGKMPEVHRLVFILQKAILFCEIIIAQARAVVKSLSELIPLLCMISGRRDILAGI
jgi:hypothetical protein